MSRVRRAASGSRGRQQQQTVPETDNHIEPPVEYEDVLDEGIEFELRDGKHYHSTAVLHKVKPKSAASARSVLLIAIVVTGTVLVAIIAVITAHRLGFAFNSNDANAVAAEDLLLTRQQLGGKDGEDVLALVSSARAAADLRAKDTLVQVLKDHDESFLQSQRHFESVTGSLQDASIRAETAANQAEAAVLSGIEQIRKTFQDETVPKLISEQAKVNEQSRLKMEKVAADLEDASAKADKAVHAGLVKVLAKLQEISEASAAVTGAGSAVSGGGSVWGRVLIDTVLAVCVATLLLS